MFSLKKWAAIVAAGLVALAVAYGAGRFTAPTKVVTKTETVTKYVDRTITEWRTRVVTKKVEGPVRVETHTVYLPSGQVASVDQVETHGPSTTTTDTSGTGSQDATSSGTVEQRQEKVVIRDQPRLMFTLSQDPLRLTDPKALGGQLQLRAWGPIWLGIQDTVEDWKHPRLTLGLTF